MSVKNLWWINKKNATATIAKQNNTNVNVITMKKIDMNLQNWHQYANNKYVFKKWLTRMSTTQNWQHIVHQKPKGDGHGMTVIHTMVFTIKTKNK